MLKGLPEEWTVGPYALDGPLLPEGYGFQTLASKSATDLILHGILRIRYKDKWVYLYGGEIISTGLVRTASVQCNTLNFQSSPVQLFFALDCTDPYPGLGPSGLLATLN